MGDYYKIASDWSHQTPGPNGVTWTITDSNLYAALAKLTWQGNTKNDMWW